MSVPIPLIGKATKWRQLCQPIRAKTYSSLGKMTGHSRQRLFPTVNKEKVQASDKENVVLDIFSMIFGKISIILA